MSPGTLVFLVDSAGKLSGTTHPASYYTSVQVPYTPPAPPGCYHTKLAFPESPNYLGCRFNTNQFPF